MMSVLNVSVSRAETEHPSLPIRRGSIPESLPVEDRDTIPLDKRRRRRRSLPRWLTLDKDYQKDRYTEYLCVNTGEWFQLSLSSKYNHFYL